MGLRSPSTSQFHVLPRIFLKSIDHVRNVEPTTNHQYSHGQVMPLNEILTGCQVSLLEIPSCLPLCMFVLVTSFIPAAGGSISEGFLFGPSLLRRSRVCDFFGGVWAKSVCYIEQRRSLY